MPGVLTTGELNSGFYVRGSESSHNQILLNGAPIYNAMHMLGFFSVFNSGHMNTFTLYKSHLDASKAVGYPQLSICKHETHSSPNRLFPVTSE